MEKIIKKEEFYKNSAIYVRILLENGKVDWLVDTTLNIIPNSRKESLEADYRVEYFDKEMD